MLKPGAGGEISTCRVRWSATGVTRLDVALSGGTEQALWISDGNVSMVGPAGGSMRRMAITAVPQNPALQAVLEFLTPAILAQHMEERYGLKQAGPREDVGPGTFLLVGKEDQDIVEIVVDENTFLPATLKKYSTDSGRTGGEKAYVTEVRFHWNQPIPEDLFNPVSPSGKQRTYH